MGVYRYTLRARTKTVSGVEIAHFAFAYKHGWGWERDNERLVSQLETAGFRACDKLTARGVHHFVGFPFGRADCTGGLPVYFTPDALPPLYTEEPPPSAKRIGTLRRAPSGRYRFINYAPLMVGELCREGVPVFYVTEPDGEGGTRYVEFPERAAAEHYAAATGLVAAYIRDCEKTA